MNLNQFNFHHFQNGNEVTIKTYYTKYRFY